MIVREEIIGDCRLILGDCLEVLPTLDRVSHTISDPPFEAEAHTKQRRELGRGSADGRRDIKDAALPFDAITPEQRAAVCEHAARLTDGWFLAFCQAEAIHDWRTAMELAGAKWRRAMVWVKPDGMPQFTGDRPGMGYESIAASWCGKGKSRWNGGGRHGVFVVNKHDPGAGHGGKSNEHPTTKPIRIMSELVQLFSAPGEAVLDPFMGSGTTGVACVKLGRRFVGIEQNEAYFDLACRRIEAVSRQADMFVSSPTPQPEQLSILDGEVA